MKIIGSVERSICWRGSWWVWGSPASNWRNKIQLLLLLSTSQMTKMRAVPLPSSFPAPHPTSLSPHGSTTPLPPSHIKPKHHPPAHDPPSLPRHIGFLSKISVLTSLFWQYDSPKYAQIFLNHAIKYFVRSQSWQSYCWYMGVYTNQVLSMTITLILPMALNTHLHTWTHPH